METERGEREGETEIENDIGEREIGRWREGGRGIER